MPAELCKLFGRLFHFILFINKYLLFIISMLYLYFYCFYKMCINYIHNFTFYILRLDFYLKKHILII